MIHFRRRRCEDCGLLHFPSEECGRQDLDLDPDNEQAWRHNAVRALEDAPAALEEQQ